MDFNSTPELGYSILLGIWFMFGSIALPIIISLVFLARRYILARSRKKRGTLKAPLIALTLNSIYTACAVAIMLTMEMGPYPTYIGASLTLLTSIFWAHDSLSWRQTKKGTRYLALYVVGSVCLILVLAVIGTIDGVRIYNDQTQAEAKGLAAVQSIGTQLYLPKDMTDTIIYIRPTADKKHSYLDISKIPLTAYQYNNIFIPSKLHCYPDNPGSYDPNAVEEPSGCTYMGKINGMEVWGYDRKYDDHVHKTQYIFAHISTTTIVVDYPDNTPNNVLSYIKSLHPATDEEVNKY